MYNYQVILLMRHIACRFLVINQYITHWLWTNYKLKSNNDSADLLTGLQLLLISLNGLISDSIIKTLSSNHGENQIKS